MTTPARREWIEQQVNEHFPNTGIDSTTFRKVLTDAMACADANPVEAIMKISDEECLRIWREIYALNRSLSKDPITCDMIRKILEPVTQPTPADPQGGGVWPNVIPPPRFENPDPGWQDAKMVDLRLLWKLGRECDYAIGLHGSLKKDMDVIAVPWTEEAVGNAELVEHLCAGLPAKRIGMERKPHGRYAVTLQLDGYYKPIDLSIMPRTTQSDPQGVRECFEICAKVADIFANCIEDDLPDEELRLRMLQKTVAETIAKRIREQARASLEGRQP